MKAALVAARDAVQYATDPWISASSRNGRRVRATTAALVAMELMSSGIWRFVF